MPVERFEIVDRRPYADGQAFGDAGPYEIITGRLHYAVDPSHPANAVIHDLDRAPRGGDGCVRFVGDIILIQPQDPDRANGALLIDVPNRGRPIALGLFNRATNEQAMVDPLNPGDGFLWRHGFSHAEVAWQWNAPNAPGLLQFDAPEALNDDGSPIGARAIADLRPSARAASMPITHLGQPGYPAAPDQPDAKLYLRDWEDDAPREIDRATWRFARQDDSTGGKIVPDSRFVHLDGGFQPGRIYEVVYDSDRSPVVGTGLLAFRDAARFLRGWSAATDRVLAFGASQSGRFLRHLLWLGLNRADDDPEAGELAFDGMHIHIAGALRGEFNHRGGQPSQLFLASYTHQFPFAAVPVRDPLTGETAAWLDRADAEASTPRIIATNTSWEYWRGDASLLHMHPDADGNLIDLPEHPMVRNYLLAGAQHGPGQAKPIDTFPLSGDRSMYRHNAVDSAPLTRAALINLDHWVAQGIEPPPSAVPSIADNTAADRPDLLSHFSNTYELPSLDPDKLSRVRTLDLGDTPGVPNLPPPEGETYSSRVAAVDAEGNETAGLPLPDLIHPLGVHTGWNPRHPDTGAPDLSSHFVGLTKWFAQEEIIRRHSSRESYLAKVKSTAQNLSADRVILKEDINLIVENCAARWDVATATE